MTISFYGSSFVYGTAVYSTAPVYAGSYPRPAQLKILLNGYDVTDHVLAESISVSSVLTRQVDTCHFVITDLATSGVVVKEWDEVKIYDGLTSIFGGYVQTIDNANAGGGLRIDATIGCADYACYLDHIYVTKEWITPVTDAAIIQYFFGAYWPYISISPWVLALKTYPRVRFNRTTLRQVLDQLADSAGGDWHIDYDRYLHFFQASLNAAPFSASSDPDMVTTMPFGNMTKNMDGTGVINRVEVVGGKYLSENATIYIQGTGQDARAILPFFLHEQSGGATGIQVWRNDGTVGVPIWTPMTVKVGYIDALAAATDVLFYYNEKVLEQQSNWPALTNAIKIACRYEIPLRSRYSDAASYAFYNSKYFDGLIVNPDIIDKETGRLAAQGVLIAKSLGSNAISFDVYQPGLFSGMLMGVINPNLSISSTFLIQRVSCKFITGGYATWSVKVGMYRLDLIDFIIKVARNASPPPVWREDDVLDEIIPTSESLALAESTFAPTTHAGAYKWGVDADNARWDFAKWS